MGFLSCTIKGIAGMRLPWRQSVAGAALLALSATATAAAECPGPSKTAFMVRSLQTELMVAALTCQIRPEYNAFVSRFKSTLVRNGKVLRSYYSLNFGDESKKRLNAYVTQLANKTSERTIDARGAYCDEAKDLYSVVLDTEPGYLEAIAVNQPLAEKNLPTACRSDIDIVTSD